MFRVLIIAAKFLGKFATIFHDVTGEAYGVADNKILIKV